MLGLQYFDFPVRWICILLVVFWLASFVWKKQYQKMYIMFFPSLEALGEYEQQKSKAFPWWKKPSSDMDDIICFLLFAVGIRFLEPAK